MACWPNQGYWMTAFFLANIFILGCLELLCFQVCAHVRIKILLLFDHFNNASFDLQSRKFDAKFSEAKYIFAAVATAFQVNFKTPFSFMVLM
jgi:hypothetical protein